MCKYPAGSVRRLVYPATRNKAISYRAPSIVARNDSPKPDVNHVTWDRAYLVLYFD